jgi:hypothetical protein
MRSLTSPTLAALIAGVVAPVYLVALQFTSGTKYVWTGINTVVWNGQNWTGQGDLLGISPITQTADLQSESITISLSGLDADDVSSVTSDVSTDSTADVWLGFLDLTTGAIIADPDHCFSGTLDVPTLQDDGDTASISITCENDLIKLAQASMRRYTNDDQAIVYPTDTGFSFVPSVMAWNGAWGGKNGGSTSGAPGADRFF